jgi:Putative Actinobacterial Holin-X, holin superfamily III
MAWCAPLARARRVRIGARIGVFRWKRPRGRNWPARLVGKNDEGIPEEESGEARKESQHDEGMIMSHVEGPTDPVPAGDPGNQSIAELIKQVSEESSRLLRGELKLAQAEMTQKAKTAGVGIGAYGAAAVLGWFALGCFLATAILSLALVLPAWLAALIVAVVVAIAAGIAALVGKKKVAEAGPPMPTDTVESVKKDVAEIKESARR